MRHYVHIFFLVATLAWLRDCLADDANLDDSKIRMFQDRIVPLFFEKCFSCHGGTTVEGGYSLAIAHLLFKPGDSGEIPIVPGHPESSEVVLRIQSHDPVSRMPLDSPPMDADEIEWIRKWISLGAGIESADSATSLLELYAKSQTDIKPAVTYSNPFPISALLISHDAKQLLVSGYGEVLVWSVDDGVVSDRIQTRGRTISDLKWAPGGKLVVASGTPGTFGVLEAFDFASKTKLAAFGFSNDLCSSLSSSPYRNEVVAGFSNGTVAIFSLDNFLPRVTSTAHAAGVTSVFWSNRGDRLFSSSLDRSAKSFDSKNGQLRSAFADHERSVGGVIDTPYGPVTLDETGALRIWSDGEEARSIAKQDGFAPSVQKLTYCNGWLMIADQARVRRISILQDEVDDESSDKKNAEKPKKKKRTRFKESESLQSLQGHRITALASDSNGLAAAGLANGQVVLWRISDSTKPWKNFSMVKQP